MTTGKKEKKKRLLQQNIGALGHMQISIPIVIKPRNGLFSAAASSPVSGNVTVTSALLFFSVPVLHFIHAARGEEGF